MEPTPNSNSNTPSVQLLPPLSIGAGNNDKAWNDPPVFSLEVNGTAKSVPTKLNKRVAYPGLSTNPVPPFTGMTSCQLPPLTAIPPTKVDFIRSFSSPGSSPEEDGQGTGVTGKATDEAMPNEMIKHRVITILEKNLKKISVSEDSDGGLKKRLAILNSSWDSLPTVVHVKLSDLVDSLEVGDYSRSDSIQQALSSDFMTHCDEWIIVLQQIIHKNL